MRAHFRARPESGTGNLKRESLGKQMVEGVEAEGTRTTITIPANQIGNERAIEITSERWYSEELAAVIMSRELDPRSGETRYRLTNLSRAEPSRSLFEVPSDYTVEDVRQPRRPFPDIRPAPQIRPEALNHEDTKTPRNTKDFSSCFFVSLCLSGIRFC